MRGVLVWAAPFHPTSFSIGTITATFLTTQRAPAWLRELAVAQEDYAEQLGWPVSMRVGARNLVIAIGTVLDAVSMPAGLGVRVRQELERPARRRALPPAYAVIAIARRLGGDGAALAETA